MDSYDPSFNPNTSYPNAPPQEQAPPGTPDCNDPDMGYIHNSDARDYDPNTLPDPGVDAEVYDHHGDLGDDVENRDHYYGDEQYPEGDIPHHVGIEYSADENGNYGDGFDDDDDVYMDNHRNNSSPEIESSDPKDGAADAFWRNCVMSCTFLFLVAGLIVLVVRINQLSEEDAHQKSPYHHNTVSLRPPPPDLSTKCTHKNVLSEKGFYECEQLCEAADCCNYPTTLALSCLAGHDNECLEYHEHCNVLQLDSGALQDPPKPAQNVPQAPKDIDNKCNIESLRTVPGFEGCVNDCMQAECCWKKDGSVHSCTSLAACSGYSSCLTMDVTDHVHMDINKEISEKCSDDKMASEVGRNQCIFACSHAACCFDPGTMCPHEDARFCSQYGPCQKVFDDNGQVIQGGSSLIASKIPVAPQFLDTACSKSSLNTLPGYEMCLGACTEAECCWKGKATCLGDHGCDGYHHCTTLLDHHSSDAPAAENAIPDAPEYLAAACSSGSLDTSAGFQMCQDACMQAECCWKVTSCNRRADCSSYASNCANLVARLDQGASNTEANGNIPAIPLAPQDLNQWCDPTKVLGQEGYDRCASSCLKAGCCWRTGVTDSCIVEEDCKAWSPCTVMNGAQDPEDVAGSLTYSLEQVFDACLNHDNNVVSGTGQKSLCQIVCESGTCCFDETKGCPETLDCKVFEPCQILHSEKQTQVEAACNGDDLSDCVGICATGTCCFTNDIQKICDVSNPNVICKQYKACEVLYSAEIVNP